MREERDPLCFLMSRRQGCCARDRSFICKCKRPVSRLSSVCVTMVGPADDEEEIFELVDEEDRVVGTAPRAQCHAEGLLHRAVYCWVTDLEGRILLQQRSLAKKMGPGQWDLSVAEHLQPGETYIEVLVCRGCCSRVQYPGRLQVHPCRAQGFCCNFILRIPAADACIHGQGAVRGLEEELGIRTSTTELVGPLAPTHLRDLQLDSFHDRELVQSYLLPGWEGGHLRIDPAEVATTRWVSREELEREVASAPQNFTAWILAEGTALDWLRGSLPHPPRTSTDRGQIDTPTAGTEATCPALT